MTVQIRLLPNPYRLDWDTWASAVTGYNTGLPSEVNPDDDWKDFAERFCESVPQAPAPRLFDNWQDWAAALKLALQV